MDARRPEQARAPPPPWGYPPPTAAATYQTQYPHYNPSHYPPNPRLYHHHQQQQPPYHHRHPPPWPPAPPDPSQYQYQAQALPPGPSPPAPPFPPSTSGYSHGGPPPPPYPAPYPHPPQPPFYVPVLPHQNYPSASNQVWGNSSWHHPIGSEHPERSISYNNEEDWAARAREWAEAKSSTDNHHTPVQFRPVGRMESHDQQCQESFQQAPCPLAEIQISSYSTSQQLPASMISSHKQINHLEDPTPLNMHTSPHASEAGMPYVISPEGQNAGKGTARLHVNCGLGSSLFVQEVPSSYSSFPGKIDADKQEMSHTALPSVHEDFQKLHPALPLQARERHHIQKNQSTPVDASDQPLVFDPMFTFEHSQKQEISYSNMDVTGSLEGADLIEGPPPSLSSWTPSVRLSHVPPVPSGPQHDSSSQTLSSVNVHPAPMFGRMPAPSFHPGIPSVRVPFGLGAAASMHHLSTFPEDASGTFKPVDHPKKASVPNWLREELLKKKASIASSLQEQPTGRSFSSGADDGVKSSGKADQADSKSIDSAKSDDDEDEEFIVQDDVEAARSAAITQEIKRILTDILLKVTDDLFKEIATKVIDEDDDFVVEVDNTISSKTVESPVTSATTKSSIEVPVSDLGNSTQVAHAENFSLVSSKGNILGLANYASDDDDDQTQHAVITSSMPTSIHQPHLNHNHFSENMVKGIDESVSEEKIKESCMGPKGGGKGGKETSNDKSFLLNERNCTNISSGSQVAGDKSSKDAFGANTGYGETESLISVPTKKAEDFSSGCGYERETTYSVTEKPDLEGELAHDHANGQCMSDESRKARIKSGSTGGNTDKKRHDVETGIVKVTREYANDGSHRRGDNKRKSKERVSKSDHLPRSSKDVDHLSEKNMAMSAPRKRVTRENERTKKEYEEDKRVRSNEEHKKRDQIMNVKEDNAGKRHRDSYRSKHAHSPSTGSRVLYSKNNSFGRYGGASSGEVSDDPPRRKSQSDKRGLSRSPSQSRRRQASRSPPAKHSQRRHSPFSYSVRRRKPRSNSPMLPRR